MKWIIILGLISLVLILIYSRYRKQIQTALYVFRMFRKMRQMSKTGEKQIDAAADSTAANLVNCAKCGTWILQNKALKLRSSGYYCSANCLKTIAEV